MITKTPAGNRNDWLALRHKDVTASAAAALLGAHPFMTAFELWHLKNGTLKEDPEETPAMQRGRLLEPVAVQLLRELQPDWVIEHNSGRRQVYWRDDARRIGCTPDVLIDADGKMGIVQIKSVEPNVFAQKWLSEGRLHKRETWVVEPPTYVLIQAIIEAMLTGAEVAYVAPLVVMHGLEMPLIQVPLHEPIWARLLSEISQFWKMIEDGEEPEPNWRKDAKLLMDLGRTDNGLEIDLTSDNRMPELLQQRFDAKARIKVDEAIVEECDGEIAEKLGEYERAHVPGWRVARPTVKRKGYEVKPTQFRQFKISKL